MKKLLRILLVLICNNYIGSQQAAENIELYNKKSRIEGISANLAGTIKILHDLNQGNYLQAIENCIKSGDDVNEEGYDGLTPLVIACRYNNKDLVKLLIGYKAKVNTTDKLGNTPLHEAARHDFIECAKILFEHGIDVNKKNNCREIPLFTAAFGGATKCVALFIQKGALVNKKGCYGMTPLHAAAYHDSIDCAKLLFQHGAKVNENSSAGWTPLHIAVKFGAINCVALFLQEGALVNTTNLFGMTPLHTAAAENKDIDCTALLLVYGAKIKPYKNFHKYPPMNETVQKAVEAIIKNPSKYNYSCNTKNIILFFLAREYEQASLLHKDYLPFDVLKKAMNEAATQIPLSAIQLQKIINFFKSQGYKKDNSFMQLLQKTLQDVR